MSNSIEASPDYLNLDRRNFCTLIGATLASPIFKPRFEYLTEPSPPWTGRLTGKTPRFELDTQGKLTLQDWLPPNRGDETVGVFGLNKDVVMISPWQHFVPRDQVSGLEGQDLSADPPAFWHGKVVAPGQIYSIVQERPGKYKLSEIGPLQLGGRPGVYAVSEDKEWLVISRWLHFVKAENIEGWWSPQHANSQFLDKSYQARKILSGWETYNVEPDTPISGISEASTDKFVIYVLNAIRQLGHVIADNADEYGEKIAVSLLNEYQLINDFPQSPIINQAILQRIDKQLAEMEKRDQLGKSFPAYQDIPEPLPHSPSKEHFAYLYLIASNAFPPRLSIPREAYSHPQNVQANSYFIGLGEGNEHIYPTEFFFPDSDISKVITIIHEYTHYLDFTGKIDATDFYNISFQKEFLQGNDGWKYYRMKVNPNDSDQLRKHFFSYAHGWKHPSEEDYRTRYEDLAVSVEMYVAHGRVFRDYMKDKPVLTEKYNWIKDNIFDGREFNTGDPNYKDYAPDLFHIGHGIWSAGGIVQLRPNYVWDYQLPYF